VRKIIGSSAPWWQAARSTEPRSHSITCPNSTGAYFGRCYASILSVARARVGDRPDGRVRFHKGRVLAYVREELVVAELNVFDAALALIALGNLGAETAAWSPAAALHCEPSRRGRPARPFKAHEWNKMKTPTRILVGGPEVTSAFVMMGLALARRG